MEREQKNPQRAAKWFFFLPWFGLFWAVLWLYAPAFHFGLIWDDPEWFGRVAGRDWWDILRPMADYQFYRPGTMLYNRLFFGADGLFNAHFLHWWQIGLHLLGVATLFALSRQVGFSYGAAYGAALLFALNPFAHQAVAWAAPQQPLVLVLLNMAWLFFLKGRRRWPEGGERKLYSALSLLFFTLALLVQESAALYAALPLLFVVALDWPTAVSPLPSLLSARPWRRMGWLPWVYPGLAAIYLIFWWLAPREAGITRLAFEPQTGAYLAQGLVYPAVWLLPDSLLVTPTHWLVVLSLLLLALWGLAVARKRGVPATLGLVWAFLGIAPALFGLPYSYVELAPRLLYIAAPGVAWLWVCAFWPAPAGRRRPLATALGLGMLAFMALGGARQVAAFQQLYQVGVAHLQQVIDELGGSNGRYLFLNFPDRYAPKESPYPFGYWGVILAPVVVDLGEFPALLVGGRPQTISRALPWIDTEAREQGPYQVEMRGSIAQPDVLYQLASEVEAIYLTRYTADGRFQLQRAGALRAGAAERACPLARFDETICLHAINVRQDKADGRWRVRLFWSTEAELEPHLTIFAHLGQVAQPPLDQQDGDVWRGALPMRYWQPGDLIEDQRSIVAPGVPGEFSLQIGVYNRLTGERLSATDRAGQPLPDNAYSRLLFPDEDVEESGD